MANGRPRPAPELPSRQPPGWRRRPELRDARVADGWVLFYYQFIMHSVFAYGEVVFRLHNHILKDHVLRIKYMNIRTHYVFTV